MGNRSFLYLGTPQHFASGDGRPFAEANNSFPALWRLLLASGGPAPAIDTQRVFGDAGTRNLASRATPAIARIRALAEGLRQHPLLDTQPYLHQHFEALVAYYEAEVAALGAPPADDLWFSADLDELSWLDGDAPDDFIAKEQAACDDVAARVETGLAAHDFPGVDNALEIDSYGATFADWRSWAWNFGFGGIDHPYFAMQDEPRTVPFAEFRVEDDDDGDRDSYLGAGLERITENGRVGVVKTAEVLGLRLKETQRTVLIPPEWDRIESAGHSKLPLFWVTRDGRTGLLRADKNGTTLLHPCALDAAWSFERVAAQALAVVQVGDDMGLLADDGAWIARPDAISPPMTEIWAFTGTHAIAASGDKQGVISASGAWTVPPTFDTIDELQADGGAITRSAETRRLIDVRSGEFRSPPLAALEWLVWPGVFEGRSTAAGSTGWWRADGKPLIAAQWDRVELLQEKPWLVRVVRDGLNGVRDRDDRERIAPTWEWLEARASGDGSVIPGHLDEMIVGREGRYGLVDGRGAELIPLQYDAIGNFPPRADDDGDASVDGTMIQVQRETPDGPRVGAWSLEARREIVPCEYDHLFAITLYRDGKTAVPGFLAVNHAPGDARGDAGPLRVGLLHADGRVLHEAKYAWIAERYHVTDYPDAMLTARTLARRWTAKEPVQAAMATDDAYVWLHRDGTSVNDVEARTAQFRAGDFTAAHALALQYRDGEGVPQDDALAQRWMLLAAGQPDTVFNAPAPGLFRRLLGGKAPSPLVPSSPDARGDVQAMCDLAQSVVNADVQDQEELAAARAWMEIAVARGRDRDRTRGNAEAHMLLGFMLLEGIGGPHDEVRALEISTRAAALGNTTASFNLGLMYQYGRGTAIDRARAIRHYTTASKAGDLGADLNLGRMLQEPAADGAPAAAKDVKQAVYHLQRAIDCVTPDIAAAAKGELGRLYWSGTGVKRDRKRAEALLREAAGDGDAAAQAFLAAEVDGTVHGS